MALARRNCAVGSGSARGSSESARSGFRRGPTRACCRSRVGEWPSPSRGSTIRHHVFADVILFGFVRGGFDWLLNPNPPGITSETVCTVRIRKKKSETVCTVKIRKKKSKTVCTVRMCIFCNSIFGNRAKKVFQSRQDNFELSDFFSRLGGTNGRG